jgi:tetratricopeptide (TPR) repeat protein
VPDRLRANTEVLRRYFPTRAPQVSPETVDFAKHKRPGSYRLVVQGGSTAAGFPYGQPAGLASMLGERLEATFPNRDIEVVSTAMAAVNSYTLLDFASEIVEIEPDVVLVYAGHNEYMGVMGVASGLTARRSRPATLLHMRLGRFRFFQLLQQLISACRSLLGEVEQAFTPGETLMRQAARGVEVEFGSEVQREGVRQFEANLEALLDTYRSAGIPVYLGTLVSNEKDQKPLAGGDPEAADSANAWFARGRRELTAGNHGTAREAFRNARDRDRLPFRAPEALNEWIRRAVQADGVNLVDVQRRFEQASPGGIVGNELLLEHVHPNAEGYFLLADAFYDALRRNREIGDWSGAPPRDRSRRDMPITAVDRILADQIVRELRADFPFTETRREVAFPVPRNEIEELARQRHEAEIEWMESMDRLMQIHRRAGRENQAAVVARIAAQTYPAERSTNFSAGMLYLRLKQPARARLYLDRSLAADPAHVPTLQALIRVNLALDDKSLARAHLVRLEELDPDHPLIERLAE